MILGVLCTAFGVVKNGRQFAFLFPPGRLICLDPLFLSRLKILAIHATIHALLHVPLMVFAFHKFITQGFSNS